MARSISPGKIILAGEYVGIFGEPIILTSVNLHTETVVKSENNKEIVITSDRFVDEGSSMSRNGLEGLWNEANEDYSRYLQSGNIGFLQKYRAEALTPITLAVAAAVEDDSSDLGLRVSTRTELPVGAGLGSSASMVSSVVGGVWTVLGKTFDKEDLNRTTYKVEQILNGKPSGGDNSGVVYGGWLKFKREGEELKITELLGSKMSSGWWLVDGGKPKETTLDMIGMVLEYKKQDEVLFRDLIKQEAEIIKLTEKQIIENNLNPDLLNESQKILEQMGVIGEKGKVLMRAIWEAGGKAKISGAGGISDGVGTILTYFEDEAKLSKLSGIYGFTYRPVILGGEGWRIEQ